MFNKKTIQGYAFLLPALFLLTIFLFLPLLMSIYYSFTDFYLLSPQEKEFVGIDNYTFLFSDPLFIKSLKNTMYFVLIVVPVQTSVALALAILINKKLMFQKFFRTAFFSPVVMSMVVVSILWTFLYNPSEGLINSILSIFGIENQPFLTSKSQAMNSIIFMSVWQGAGYQMMIFLAGLQAIPTHLYEAASIDGANRWRQFIHVTIPGLKNVLIFVLITITISAFKLLIQPMVMTQGGPVDSTKTIVYMIYEVGFKFRDMGYASAVAVAFMLIVLIISVIQRKVITEERN